MTYTYKLSNGTDINIDISNESKKTQEYFLDFIKSEIIPIIKGNITLSEKYLTLNQEGKHKLDIPLNYLINEHRWEIFLNSDLSSNIQIQDEIVNKLSNLEKEINEAWDSLLASKRLHNLQ